MANVAAAQHTARSLAVACGRVERVSHPTQPSRAKSGCALRYVASSTLHPDRVPPVVCVRTQCAPCMAILVCCAAPALLGLLFTERMHGSERYARRGCVRYPESPFASEPEVAHAHSPQKALRWQSSSLPTPVLVPLRCTAFRYQYSSNTRTRGVPVVEEQCSLEGVVRLAESSQVRRLAWVGACHSCARKAAKGGYLHTSHERLSMYAVRLWAPGPYV